MSQLSVQMMWLQLGETWLYIIASISICLVTSKYKSHQGKVVQEIPVQNWKKLQDPDTG